MMKTERIDSCEKNKVKNVLFLLYNFQFHLTASYTQLHNCWTKCFWIFCWKEGTALTWAPMTALALTFIASHHLALRRKQYRPPGWLMLKYCQCGTSGPPKDDPFYLEIPFVDFSLTLTCVACHPPPIQSQFRIC